MENPYQGAIDALRIIAVDQIDACKPLEAQTVAVPANTVLDILAAFQEINTPEVVEFVVAIQREAMHQRLRWPSEHDAGKADSDWFWLLGWLAGKAVHATDPEQRLHHIITTAAACLNWHAARVGAHTGMRPGIEPPKEKE